MASRDEERAAAIERRLQQQREQAQAAQTSHVQTAFDENHERRQEFRRMIDPGILRPNSRELALESLQILKTLAENILEHPNEEKYHKFKPTNPKIKHLLVEPKGTLEYAVAMGFRPEVENFQPFYIFENRRLSDLKIGLAMIKEVLEREITKKERDERVKREAKEAEAAAKEKLKRQFLDDRKSTALRQQREREARVAAAEQRSASPSSPSTPTTTVVSTPGRGRGTRAPARMRGTGRTLNGQIVTPGDEDVPPAYHELSAQEEDEEDEDEDEDD